MPENRVQRRLAAILSADVVGYSRMMEADEAGTLARLKVLRQEVIDPAIATFSGRTVKLMGDGALVEFASAVDAVTCAIQIQKSVGERDTGRAAADPILFRVGINVGDIIVEGDDIYGDGVNIAARIEALAQPGEIYLSRSAADQVRDKLEIQLESLGEHTLKNIARPVDVYRTRNEGNSAGEPSGRPVTRTPPPVPDKPSIAVLAFNNMSNDPEQEYFSDGISEDIITDLSKLSGLHVIARNSSFVYKERTVSVPQVAGELGVRYVLEGSVRKAGNRVRVTAQLIDATGGGHVWADRFDRDLTDVFAVQDELTKEIVRALSLKLTADEADRLGQTRVDIEAYNLFLRGREQVWLHTKTGNVTARGLLERAIAIEPHYAAAHAYAAFTHVIDYVNNWTEARDQALRTAIEMAELSIGLDDAEPMTHFALSAACLWHREHERALTEARRCIALEPSASEGHMVKAHAQIYGGDAAGAIATIDACMRLDPHFNRVLLHFLAEARFALGQFEEAVNALEQRLARNPESDTSHALLASCYGHLGRTGEGQAAWAETLRLNPGFSIEQRWRILPLRDPADLDSRVDGLRKAGLAV